MCLNRIPAYQAASKAMAHDLYLLVVEAFIVALFEAERLNHFNGFGLDLMLFLQMTLRNIQLPQRN